MSASLVGSEMCIRDRPKSPPEGLQTRAPRRGLRARGHGSDGVSVAGEPCLLYTSDAADDM
eukprot:1286591-Alexandrium_andersonii.AAC.1